MRIDVDFGFNFNVGQLTMIIESDKFPDSIDVFGNHKRIVKITKHAENKFVITVCIDFAFGRWISVKDKDLFAYLLGVIDDYETAVSTLYRIWDFMVRGV